MYTHHRRLMLHENHLHVLFFMLFFCHIPPRLITQGQLIASPPQCRRPDLLWPGDEQERSLGERLKEQNQPPRIFVDKPQG